jgi:hypothetical protein
MYAEASAPPQSEPLPSVLLRTHTTTTNVDITRIRRATRAFPGLNESIVIDPGIERSRYRGVTGGVA